MFGLDCGAIRVPLSGSSRSSLMRDSAPFNGSMVRSHTDHCCLSREMRGLNDVVLLFGINKS